MKLVLVPLRCGTALEIADIGFVVGDNQRALELACVLFVYSEISRQLHRAAHALGNVDEGSVGEDCRIQRREVIVTNRNHRAHVTLHKFGIVADRL